MAGAGRAVRGRWRPHSCTAPQQHANSNAALRQDPKGPGTLSGARAGSAERVGPVLPSPAAVNGAARVYCIGAANGGARAGYVPATPG
jgi:hypothetical protein